MTKYVITKHCFFFVAVCRFSEIYLFLFEAKKEKEKPKQRPEFVLRIYRHRSNIRNDSITNVRDPIEKQVKKWVKKRKFVKIYSTLNEFSQLKLFPERKIMFAWFSICQTSK